MSLRYDLTGLNEKHKKRVLREWETCQLYSTLVLCTELVGIPEITELNYEKFYNRLHLLECVNGAFFYHKRYNVMIPDYIHINNIKELIGLKTNATKLTACQFLKRLHSDKF